MTYRKVTTCSPIHVDSFEKLEQTSSPNGTLPVDRLYLGPSAFGLLEYTYQYAVESVRDGIGYGLKLVLSTSICSSIMANTFVVPSCQILL